MGRRRPCSARTGVKETNSKGRRCTTEGGYEGWGGLLKTAAGYFKNKACNGPATHDSWGKGALELAMGLSLIS